MSTSTTLKIDFETAPDGTYEILYGERMTSGGNPGGYLQGGNGTLAAYCKARINLPMPSIVTQVGTDWAIPLGSKIWKPYHFLQK